MLAVLAIVLAVTAPAIGPAVVYGQDLAPGPVSELVVQACSSCHSLDHVTSARKDANSWRDTVMSMVQQGAVLNEAQVDEISSYLAEHYSIQPSPAAASSSAGGAAAGRAIGAADAASPN